MPVPTYRILASFIPVQAALMAAFVLFAIKPTRHPVLSSPKADRVVISKSQHTLALYAHGAVLHTYHVSLGRDAGAKHFAGDHKTPEGHYTVDAKNPHSRFHLALHLSYPNASDVSFASNQHRMPGADVEIHGLLPFVALVGSLHRTVDWTDGCIAVTNNEIDEIDRLTPIGTPVEINP